MGGRWQVWVQVGERGESRGYSEWIVLFVGVGAGVGGVVVW